MIAPIFFILSMTFQIGLQFVIRVFLSIESFQFGTFLEPSTHVALVLNTSEWNKDQFYQENVTNSLLISVILLVIY